MTPSAACILLYKEDHLLGSPAAHTGLDVHKSITMQNDLQTFLQANLVELFLQLNSLLPDDSHLCQVDNIQMSIFVMW